MTKRLHQSVLVAVWMATAFVAVNAQNNSGQDTMVLTTLDGARVQEIFGGMDLEILDWIRFSSSVRPRRVESTSTGRVPANRFLKRSG